MYGEHIYISKANVKNQKYQWDHDVAPYQISNISESYYYKMSGTLNAQELSPNTSALVFDNSTFTSKKLECENAQYMADNLILALTDVLKPLLETSKYDISLVYYGFEYFE